MILPGHAMELLAATHLVGLQSPVLPLLNPQPGLWLGLEVSQWSLHHDCILIKCRVSGCPTSVTLFLSAMWLLAFEAKRRTLKCRVHRPSLGRVRMYGVHTAVWALDCPVQCVLAAAIAWDTLVAP